MANPAKRDSRLAATANAADQEREPQLEVYGSTEGRKLPNARPWWPLVLLLLAIWSLIGIVSGVF
jgi:hypothetical protein